MAGCQGDARTVEAAGGETTTTATAAGGISSSSSSTPAAAAGGTAVWSVRSGRRPRAKGGEHHPGLES